MSEAPSDYETDTVIQRTLRNELAKDVTLLIVAHRLQTVMDADKIVRHIASGNGVLYSLAHIRRWFWMQDTLWVIQH